MACIPLDARWIGHCKWRWSSAGGAGGSGDSMVGVVTVETVYDGGQNRRIGLRKETNWFNNKGYATVSYPGHQE